MHARAAAGARRTVRAPIEQRVGGRQQCLGTLRSRIHDVAIIVIHGATATWSPVEEPLPADGQDQGHVLSDASIER